MSFPEVVEAINKNHIQKVDVNTFQCCICKIPISGEAQVAAHLQGTKHNKANALINKEEAISPGVSSGFQRNIIPDPIIKTDIGEIYHGNEYVQPTTSFFPIVSLYFILFLAINFSCLSFIT